MQNQHDIQITPIHFSLTEGKKLGTMNPVMEKFFSFFGKAVLVILVVGTLAGGGYYVGKSGKFSIGLTTPAPEAVSTTNPETTTTLAMSPSTSTTPTAMAKTMITAGLGKESGLSFTKYTIEVPEGWTPAHTTTNDGTYVDTLTIVKGAYQVKIFQAATGGAMCLYPGDADFEGPSSKYETFVDITTKDGIILRRGGSIAANGPSRGYTLCQKGSESYGQPTGFGHTGYTTPITPDANVLLEMDGMIKSLKKI
jgi:hypothetical protein